MIIELKSLEYNKPKNSRFVNTVKKSTYKTSLPGPDKGLPELYRIVCGKVKIRNEMSNKR